MENIALVSPPFARMSPPGFHAAIFSSRFIYGVLSIIPNRPVRDQWEYPKKMGRHFPIKPGQPKAMALATFYSFSEFSN